MRSYPTVEEIQETYQAVYDFLDFMHAAIAETQQAQEFEELFDLSDQVDAILSELESPFEGLERLRALAEHMRGASIGDKVDSWAVSAVKMFGEFAASWIRNTADYIRTQEIVRTEGKELNPFEKIKPALPFDLEGVGECLVDLRQEEAWLIGTALDILNGNSKVPAQIIVPTQLDVATQVNVTPQIDVATQVNAPIDVNVGPCMSNAVVNEVETPDLGSKSPVLNTANTDSVKQKRKSPSLSDADLLRYLEEAEIVERWREFQSNQSSKKRNQTLEFLRSNSDLETIYEVKQFRALLKRVKGRKNDIHTLREEVKRRGSI